jgi:hypothetical protein
MEREAAILPHGSVYRLNREHETRVQWAFPRAPSQQQLVAVLEYPLANGNLNWMANFIWGIADNRLRDLVKPDKYPDVIILRFGI